MHSRHVVALVVLGFLTLGSFGGFLVDETTPVLAVVVAVCRSLALFGTVVLASSLLLRRLLSARGSEGLMPPPRRDDLDAELTDLIDQERGQQGLR